MNREPSEKRARIVLACVILFWFIVTIIFGFILDKPTSFAGFSMITIFLIFILVISFQFLYSKYKKQALNNRMQYSQNFQVLSVTTVIFYLIGLYFIVIALINSNLHLLYIPAIVAELLGAGCSLFAFLSRRRIP